MNSTQTPRIERGTTYLVVPKGRFVLPSVGPDNYVNVAKAILAKGQSLPTGEQNAFLLDEVYNSNVKEFKESPEAESIRGIMKNNFIWVFNRNLWTPKNIKNPGMYVQFDSQGVGNSQILEVSQLEDALSGGSTERGVRFSKDRKTAFAPLNTIRAGSHDKGTLAQDGAFIASYNVEGAEKLDNVARAFTLKPYSWVVDNTGDKPVQSLSRLYRYWYDDVRLYAYFDNHGGNRNGYALGVSGSGSSAGGTAQKI